MKEQDASEILKGVTDEQWKRYDEIRGRLYAAPFLSVEEYLPMPITPEMAEWLMNKYRAAYDMGMLVQEISGEVVEDRADHREDFAKRMVDVAGPYFQMRLGKTMWGAIRGVLGEMDASLGMFMEAAFKGAESPSFKRSLPTKKEVLGLWQTIIQDHIDPRFVRDGRGGDRKSAAGLSEEERAAIVERKKTLTPFWDELIKQLQGRRKSAENSMGFGSRSCRRPFTAGKKPQRSRAARLLR